MAQISPAEMEISQIVQEVLRGMSTKARSDKSTSLLPIKGQILDVVHYLVDDLPMAIAIVRTGSCW